MVPDVNWMLTISLWERGDEGVGGDVDVSDDIEVQGVRALNGEGSTRPAEFSTRMMFWREEMEEDSSLEDERLGTRDCNSSTLLFGGLNGRFVSVPMIKCEADKWLKADVI